MKSDQADVRHAGIRERLVQAAIELLAEEGPEALQVRRVAAAVGVTSSVVYNRFGGMAPLVEAVVDEGFRRLGDRFSNVAPTDDAIADLISLALSFHDSARQNPHLFDLMFRLSTPGGYRQIARSQRTTATAVRTPFDHAYEPLAHHARRAMRAKRLRRQDPDRVAAEIWSVIQGFTTLDLGGYHSQFPDPIVDVLGRLATHLAVGLGDTPQRAARSTAKAIARARS